MTKHSDLIARLEALTGPDMEVDWDIGLNVGGMKSVRTFGMAGNWFDRCVDETSLSVSMPDYTASIDAAVALCERVLPGWRWGITQGTEDDDEVQGNVWPETTPFTAYLDSYGYHANPAIALLIAILKALDAKETAND